MITQKELNVPPSLEVILENGDRQESSSSNVVDDVFAFIFPDRKSTVLRCDKKYTDLKAMT